MGLKVYRGINSASQGSESEFFDELAGKLKSVFEEYGLDGVLLAHPVARDDEYLWPDCLLIVPNSILIIDFKRYKGKLNIPSEYYWLNGVWKNNDTVTVRGGSSANPFEQLEKQRQRLSDALHIDKSGISTGVCFHGGPMQVLGKIPNACQQRFFIADSDNYMLKIFNYINVRKQDSPFPLTDAEMQQIASRFDVKEYKDFRKYSLKEASNNGELNEAIYRYKSAVANVERMQRKIYAGMAILAIVIVMAVVAYFLYNNNRIRQAEYQAAQQRSESILNGSECMNVDEVSEYVGETGVCVTYYVNNIGSTDYGYVWINDKKDGDFAAFIKSKNVMSASTARKQYMNKRIEVHGDLEKYEKNGKTTYQIQVKSKNQIKIVE